MNDNKEHRIEYVTIMAENELYDDANVALTSEDGTNDETNYTNNHTMNNNNLSDGPVDRKKVSLYEKWVTFFVADGIQLMDDKLVCTICNRQISADKKSRLSEHVNSKKHKKNVDLPEDQRPNSELEPYTPAAKRLKTYSNLERKSDGRDKSHEILMADTLNLFVQLDVPFERLNSEAWQNFVKKHVKNGEHILKNFQIYSKSGH